MFRRLNAAYSNSIKILTRKGLYNFLEIEFEKIKSDERVLSIGAGGPVNDRLKKHREKIAFDLIQLDIDESASPDIVADICTWRSAKAFNVVILSEVLEHLYAPQSGIENILDSLVPGGRLVLTTPFVFPIHSQPNDYFRYTKYGLKYLLRDFVNIEIQERNNWGEALCVLLLRTAKARERPLKIVSPLVVIVAVVGYPLAWLIGNLFQWDALTTGYLVTADKASA